MKSSTCSLGKISALKLFASGLGVGCKSHRVVTAFLNQTESVAHRWIESRRGILVLAMVPYNPASGAIYVYDRSIDLWYMLSFEAMDSQFTDDLFNQVCDEYNLAEYMIQPDRVLNLLEKPSEAQVEGDGAAAAAA